jgi:hypothetical protein
VEDSGWVIPAEQLLRKEPPHRGIKRRTATEWYPGSDGPESDSGPEDAESEEETVPGSPIRPDEEIAPSDATPFPWSSSQHGWCDQDDEDIDEEMKESSLSSPVIPAAQLPRSSPDGFTARLFRTPTPKEEPASPVIPPTQGNGPSQIVPPQESFELPSSWELPTIKCEVKTGSLPSGKVPSPQLTGITIEPTSSNEISYSSYYPPAQRSSFTDRRGPSQAPSEDEASDSESEKGSIASQLSAIGDNQISSDEDAPESSQQTSSKHSPHAVETTVERVESLKESSVKPTQQGPSQKLVVQQQQRIIDAPRPQDGIFLFKQPSPALLTKPLPVAAEPKQTLKAPAGDVKHTDKELDPRPKPSAALS